MGNIKGATAVCFLFSLATAFTSIPSLGNSGNGQNSALKKTSCKILDRANNNPTFLPMSAGSTAPDGEYDGGWSSSSDDQTQDLESSFKAEPPIHNRAASADEMLSHSSQQLSPERQKRIEREKKNNSRFLQGDQLFELRNYIRKVEEELEVARESGFGQRILEVQTVLEEAKNMDPEYVYKISSQNAKEAEKLGFLDEAEDLRKEAMEARSLLPQFNLTGLWVGKYGDHGYEMINVTYVDEKLFAVKVTGDKNVPKGETTFTANLGPAEEDLTPIELSDVASQQWGQKHLVRFSGEGQVALEGFRDNQYVDGQLILVGEYFSFAWVPLGHQIFFGRPSAELTLKMLKQSKLADFGAGADSKSDNEVAEMRLFAQRCFEETEMLINDDIEGELNFDTHDECYFSQEGCFQ